MSIHDADNCPPELSTQCIQRSQDDYVQEILSSLDCEHGTPTGTFDFLIPQIIRSFPSCGEISDHDLWVVAHGETNHEDPEFRALDERWHLLMMAFEAALSNTDEHGVDYGNT